MTATRSRSFVRWSLCAAMLVLAAPFGAVLQAQSNAAGTMRGDIELTRAGIQSDRTTIVTAFMDLTSAQSEKFWPLYRAYREEAQKTTDETVKFMSGLADRTTPLSDSQAKRLLDMHLKRQADAAKVNSKYAKQFLKILPATQVARLFQLENKMDAIVAFELAGSVPLVGGSRSSTPPNQ